MMIFFLFFFFFFLNNVLLVVDPRRCLFGSNVFRTIVFQNLILCVIMIIARGSYQLVEVRVSVHVLSGRFGVIRP